MSIFQHNPMSERPFNRITFPETLGEWWELPEEAREAWNHYNDAHQYAKRLEHYVDMLENRLYKYEGGSEVVEVDII